MSASVRPSTISLCCDNWNSFLQRTFKFDQNVCLGKILVKFKYGLSGICLSVRPSFCPHFLCAAITGILFYREFSNLVRMFVWVRSWSSSNMGHLGSACPSFCPHFLCAAITGILFYREFSNLVRMFVWVRSWSSLNMGHLGSVCVSVRPHFLCAAITGILFYR